MFLGIRKGVPRNERESHRKQDAIRDPKTLDGNGLFPASYLDVSSACFIDTRHLVISLSDDFAGHDETKNPDAAPANMALWDLIQSRKLSDVALTAPAGTLMAIDNRFVVGFYEHPKLIELQTGQIVSRLDSVDTGKQTSSIIHHIDPVPPLALDPKNRRFAVASLRTKSSSLELLQIRRLAPCAREGESGDESPHSKSTYLRTWRLCELASDDRVWGGNTLQKR